MSSFEKKKSAVEDQLADGVMRDESDGVMRDYNREQELAGVMRYDREEQSGVMRDDIERGLSSTTNYIRKSTSTLEGAVLKFDNVTFVAGKGKNEKVIVQKVGATIRPGRK